MNMWNMKQPSFSSKMCIGLQWKSQKGDISLHYLLDVAMPSSAIQFSSKISWEKREEGKGIEFWLEYEQLHENQLKLQALWLHTQKGDDATTYIKITVGLKI